MRACEWNSSSCASEQEEVALLFSAIKKEPHKGVPFLTRSEAVLWVEAGADAGERAAYLAAQEGEDNNHDDGDQDEDQSVLYQALAFLLQLFDLSAHLFCLHKDNS